MNIKWDKYLIIILKSTLFHNFDKLFSFELTMIA